MHKKVGAMGVKSLMVPLITLIIYREDLLIVFNEALKNDILNYTLAVPFLLAYMVYRKRETLGAVVSTPSIEDKKRAYTENLVGFATCLSALFLYAYGSFTFYTLEYHLVSLPLFVAGCILTLFNYLTLRVLTFPIAFLLLVLTPPWENLYQAGAQLSAVTSEISYNLLKLFGLPVKLTSMNENPMIVIQNGSEQPLLFAIDIACTGIYSMLGFLTFALFIAYIAKGTPQKKSALFLTGSLLMYGLNVARVFIIVLIGHWWGYDTTMGLLHTSGGMTLIFLGIMILLFFGEKILKIDFSNHEMKAKPCLICEQSQRENETFCLACGRLLNSPIIRISKNDIYKIVALTIVSIIIISLQLPTFVLTSQNSMLLYLQKISGGSESQQFLPSVAGYEPRFLQRYSEFEKISQQDATLLYVYRPENQSHAPIFVTVEIADSYSKLHRWEICLFIVPSRQERETVTQLELKDVQILENPPLVGRLYVYRPIKSSVTVVILYWYERASFKIDSGWGYKYVKTSLIAYADSFAETNEIESPKEYQKIENKLLSIAQSIESRWEPVKAWSPLVIMLSQWGQNLAIAMILSVALMATYNIWWKEGENSTSLHKQLSWYSSFSKEEKTTLKVVETLTKIGKSTGITLANAYQKLTGKTVKPQELLQVLKHAEESGLIKRSVTIKQDQPVLLWESQISAGE